MVVVVISADVVVAVDCCDRRIFCPDFWGFACATADGGGAFVSAISWALITNAVDEDDGRAATTGSGVFVSSVFVSAVCWRIANAVDDDDDDDVEDTAAGVRTWATGGCVVAPDVCEV